MTTKVAAVFPGIRLRIVFPMASNHTSLSFSGWLHPVILLLVGLFWLAGSQESQAQMQVRFKLDRSAYMTHEPISATLYLTNRAGRDLVLADTGDLRWLDFQVIGTDGQLMIPRRDAPRAEPVVMQAGQSYELKIYVNAQYSMSQEGSYRVKVRVLFPDTRQYFETKQESVQVTDGHEMWSQAVGIPAGLPGAGSYRQYSLLAFYTGDKARELYFRLKDVGSGQVTHTFSLGTYYVSRPPQYVLDSMNRLHVLQLGSPQAYVYTVLTPVGTIDERKGYTDRNGSRPRLVMSGSGGVQVEGGQVLEKNAVSYEEREFRAISERPPGMPAVPRRPAR